MTRPVFWLTKVFIVIVSLGATAAFITLEDVGTKGVLAASIYSLFGLGMVFKDGFSRRQWARQEYHGFNQMLRWFGLGLSGLAAAASVLWLVIWVAERAA